MMRALIALALFSSAASAIEVTGLLQGNWVNGDDLTSYQNHGTGVTRYDDNGFNVGQAFLNFKHDIGKEVTVQAIANYHQDGEQNLGLTQFLLTYKPLTSRKTKFRLRAGFFYPELSLENVDEGWLSPYTYTNSAINTWIGEEQRTIGVEASLISPGRARGSAWSWKLHASLYKANDPFGALLAWRGWALHDRQSLNNDRVNIAFYPTVISPELINGPAYVEPFHELDGNIGIYAGLHLDYYNSTNFRYYFYDNRADPTKLNDAGLYAWHTIFHSFSFQHKFNKNTRLISQAMFGSTLMGLRFVAIDFRSNFVMLSHKIKKSRVSVRVDNFNVIDTGDIFPEDLNDSDGYAVTAAWRHNFNKHWEVGVEYHLNRNTAENRVTVGDIVRADQRQTMFVAQYRWR
jgi:hypothetical protein